MKEENKIENVKIYLKSAISSKSLQILFITIIIVRLLLIFINPLVTSDFLRNIFYGKNLWVFGLNIYDMTPLDIDPNYNILDPLSGALSWELNMYDYPVLHLLFFGLISFIPFTLMFSKIIFTIVDFVNFFLIRDLAKEDNKIAWLYLIVSTPFTSLEGQVVSITVFLILINILVYERYSKKWAYFLSAISFHWKIIGIVLLPYFFIKDWYPIIKNKNFESWKEEAYNLLCFLVPLTVLFILPLLFSRYLFNSQFTSGFVYDIQPWNPLYLPSLFPSGILIALFTVAIAVIWLYKTENWETGIDFLPILELNVFFMFIYKFAMPWSWLYYIPAFMMVPDLKEFSKKRILYLIIIISSIATIDFFNITIGFGNLSDLINNIFNNLL